MNVTIDETPLATARPTLAAALEAARASAEARGRIVVEVSVDGLVVPEAALASPSESDLGQREIKIITADPVALIAGTFHDIPTLLTDARQEQSKASKLLQTGDIEAGMKSMSAALTSWETVRQVLVNGLALLGAEPKDLSVKVTNGAGESEDISIEEHVQRLASKLSELKRAMQSQDWVGVSDGLAFDLDEEAEHWTRMMRAIAMGLEKGIQQ